MASLVKRCRHRRPEWDQCGCQWLIRRKVGGRDTYTPVGSDRVSAERALARDDAGKEETVSAALDTWLAAKEREPTARPNSIVSYRGRIKHVKAWFGPMLVRQVRPEHLSQFAADLLAGVERSKPKAPATVQAIYACLTAALKHAARRGVIKTVPIPPDGPGIPAPLPRRHSLTLDEVEQIIERMPGVWGRVAELVLLTGLRWGEVVAIKPGDVQGHVVRIRRTRNRIGTTNDPKTRAGVRVIPISPRAEHLLHELVLPVGGDYRRAYDALVHAMGPLHQKGMGWHSIRNAHASLLEAAGVTLRDQAARMGHGANYAQTLAYGLVVEAGSAHQLDAARQRDPPASPAPGSPAQDELAARRARRRRAP